MRQSHRNKYFDGRSLFAQGSRSPFGRVAWGTANRDVSVHFLTHVFPLRLVTVVALIIALVRCYYCSFLYIM